MLNLSLGFLIGIGASWLYVQPHPVPWYAWGLFATGAGAVAFGFDVLIGSFKEHQPQAAWMGLGMFGGLGAVMILAASGLTW
jgi:hypothetical protein